MTTTQTPPKTSASIIISSTMLHQQLSRLLPWIKQQPIVPILENALLTTGENCMILTVSDLQSTMVVQIPVEAEGMSGIGIAFPIRKVYKFLSTIPDQPIRLSIDRDTFKLTIRTEVPYGEYTFSGDNSIDFPKLPQIEPLYSFVIKMAQLRDVVKTAKGYLSNDDLRPAMTGMYWGFFQDAAMQSWHEISATDGHTLLKLTPGIQSIITGPQGFEVILPGDLIRRLSSILPKIGDDVKVELSNRNIRLSWGNSTIISRLIDEKFPNYSSAIPDRNPTRVRLLRGELIDAIRRSLVFASPVTHQMKLTVPSPQYVVAERIGTIHAENLDFSDEMKESINFQENVGNGIVIGFNAKIMLSVLQSIPSPTIELRMSQNNRAVVIHPLVDGEADEDFLALIMPIQLSNY